MGGLAMTPTDMDVLTAKLDGILREASETKREIREDIAEIKTDMAEVKESTRRTNGRVSHLEIEQAREQGRAAAGRDVVSWVQPIVTGTLTALLVATITLFATGVL